MALEFHKAQELWQEQAHIEAENNFRLRYQHGRGPCNVFILDTSSSLGEDGFTQMKDVFKTILDEYACYPDIDENVCVIVCGKNTRFQHYYSNQYSDIKNCIDDVDFGGLSPLTAAFFLSIGGLKGATKVMGEFHIHPRIILISDGKPTNFRCTRDGEDSPLSGGDEDKDHLLQLTRKLGRRHPIFCIPIGKDPDVVLLEFISAQSRGGKMVYPSEAKQFAKYSKNMQTAAMLSFTMKNDGNDRDMILMSLACTFPDEEFTEMDQDDILDICSKKGLYNSWDEIIEEELDVADHVFKERDPRMPSLGARVRRGPDWKWNNQDSYGPGTVVGHLEDCGWLNVEWDTGMIYGYRYGSTQIEKDKFDISVCDEPRILQDEMIAVGCLVKRGPDWMWGDQDGGEGTLGSVYRVKRNGTAYIRWLNGQTSHYRFGYQGKFDLQICDPFSSESREYLQDQKRKAILNRSQDFSCTPKNGGYSASSASPRDHDLKSGGKPCDSLLVSHQRIQVLKGCYFKNDRNYDEPSSDIESDGAIEVSSANAINQWMWKDCDGRWNPYPRKINDRINQCYRRNPNSTVVVTIKEHSFRVVMSKNIQIDLMTRETFEVKFVKNE
ncbi:uncharacterized protein LOC130046250 isoform X1 [Ostrea edulis]|uniref:uncharacterized protein LOC130046250 isoform X1 n=2 Tax=Ostrea edulis TaxID=37623 RepID=UPI0020962C0F|nr:uncharacterized protein LOC130046250 isoform X1 [Ostrea edulis]XP_056021592.1 uncharacterized protein LOC130046250 isoform X1 [Ostrea edulis]XP_056021593.1 uncharacterized protein LOC130046250 isoform X1 [Ostrea edulis]